MGGKGGETRGSECLASLGFWTESRWDSGRLAVGRRAGGGGWFQLRER